MNKYLALVLLLLLLPMSVGVHANTILQQEQSAQFISYWKADVISAQQDELVGYAESIFNRLLRAWDSSRHEPGLYVVDSSKGPWAVSLVDGNILLSRQAIAACKEFGDQRAQHLLAFILAHELAHQRSDDLWQHRFFRVTGNGVDSDQRVHPLKQQMNKRMLSDMQQKESRADHDGLVLMASVGFNPYQIVDKKDFFTQWVENIWQRPCEVQSDDAISQACQQARQRALRTRSQLDTVASQSSLYQLGVQAMVAAQYQQARLYFAQYARDFPGREVMTALGISHLAQAIEIRKQLIQSGELSAANFYFPLMLDASAGLEELQNTSPGTKRAASELLNRQQQKIAFHIDKAVAHLEKAIRLAPDYRRTYQLLANAYVLANNSFMARGILQGRYLPKFGDDMASELLLALTTSIEGDSQKAIDMLSGLVQQVQKAGGAAAQQDADVMVYSVVFNLATLLQHDGQEQAARAQWQSFARYARDSGNGYLFRLVLGQIQPDVRQQQPTMKVAPTVNGLRLGSRKTRDDSSHSINELWIEGEQYHVYNYENGAQFITGLNGRIISARQQGGEVSLGPLQTGDNAERPLKTLGLPDRRLQLVSGEYLAYDQYGLAVQIDDNQILGWFLY